MLNRMHWLWLPLYLLGLASLTPILLLTRSRHNFGYLIGCIALCSFLCAVAEKIRMRWSKLSLREWLQHIALSTFLTGSVVIILGLFSKGSDLSLVLGGYAMAAGAVLFAIGEYA